MPARRRGHRVGERVFVPGARCYGEVRGLFGGAASTIVAGGSRVVPVSETLGEQAVLLALAATAYHAVSGAGKRSPIVPPDLIVGHGVLGRLLARMTVVAGFTPPTVWETNPARASGAEGYAGRRPRRTMPGATTTPSTTSAATRRSSTAWCTHLAPGGEIVLAGFYTEPLHFNFAPAFMREAQIRCAAEWQRPDLLAVARTGRERAPVAGRPDHAPRPNPRMPTRPTARRSAIPAV